MNFAHRLALPLIAAFTESVYHRTPGEAGFTEHGNHFKSTCMHAQTLAAVEPARKDDTLALIQPGLLLPDMATGQAKTRKRVVGELLSEPAAERRARQALLEAATEGTVI